MSNVVGSREGWELYIETGGVMVGILLGEGAKGWELYIETGSVMVGILLGEGAKGWELYIVTGGMMVGILMGEGAQWAPSPSNIPTIMPPVSIYSSHPSLLFTTLGIYFSTIMFDSLMMAFQST